MIEYRVQVISIPHFLSGHRVTKARQFDKHAMIAPIMPDTIGYYLYEYLLSTELGKLLRESTTRMEHRHSRVLCIGETWGCVC